MNIGEKIRDLRVAKLMTQSELAGDHITRNMLSCIENGAAQPSLSTVCYIAGRLNVPVGFLLAEEGDEIVYRKMNSLSNIKRAYSAGDWWGCRSLCLSGCPEPDDEISLLLADCDVGIAMSEFWHGRLRSSCRFFDEALSYAEKTLYQTGHIKAQARVFFHYMERISSTLYSDMLDDVSAEPFFAWNHPFSSYVEALDALALEDIKRVNDYLATAEETSFFAKHIRIALLMHDARYDRAKEQLLYLLNNETPLNEVELYTVLSELEICSKETEDYKNAYHFANERVALLESLLKEV
ncbi:MAG: helix-turn-helix transcriptional regulator [Clostridia bacterium]|nr:helix-turn-helix transcriptional regulator [Clostridia bacterium]